MNKLLKMILKNYLKFHKITHSRIISRCGISIFGGLHPKNVLNFRSEFFIQNVNENDVVIDVGCGTGLILNKIAPIIKKGYGIELSKTNFDICNRMHSSKNVEYVESDLFKVDYEELGKRTRYTTAIFSHILEHVEDVPALLSMVNASKLLICVPSQENWYTQLLIHLGLPYFTDPGHYREYSRKMLKAELAIASYQADFIGFNPEGEIICKATKTK